MPNLFILLLAIIVPLWIIHSSSKKNEVQRGIVDNEPSGGSWALALIVLVVLCIIAQR